MVDFTVDVSNIPNNGSPDPLMKEDLTTPFGQIETILENMANAVQAMNILADQGGSDPLAIASGVLTPTNMFHEIRAQTGTTDDLDTITMGDLKFLFLVARSGDTITLKHGTGNVNTFGETDLELTGNKIVFCMGYDFGSGSEVMVIGGGGGGSLDINGLTEKGSPVSADVLVIEDSEDSYNQKKVQVGNLPTGTGVSGSTGGTDNAILRADGTGGSLLQASGATIDDSGNLTANSLTPTNELAHEYGGLEDDVSGWGGILAIEGGNTLQLKFNRYASTDPGVNDDETAGYLVSSLWFNTTSGKIWMCLDQSTGAAVWKQLDASGSGNYTSSALIRDVKSTGTDGGSSSALSWQTHAIAEAADDDNILTVSSNKFVVDAGEVEIDAWAVVYKTGLSKMRLYNVTQASVEKTGLSVVSHNGDFSTSIVGLKWQFTSNGTDEYRLDVYTQNAVTTTGLGLATDDGGEEVYLEAELRLKS